MVFQSHLTFLEAAAKQSPESLCFKCAQFEDENDESSHRQIIGWKDVTYGKFYDDIQRCAKYWIKTLQAPSRSVIGVWMFGATYRDTVNYFALTLATYVPQILNLKIQSVEGAIFHFKLSDITQVIYAPGVPIDGLKNDFQVYEIATMEQLASLEIQDPDLPASYPSDENEQDVTSIYHTSGSTAGRPKLIKQTRRWVDGNARKTIPGLTKETDIALMMNGMAHVSEFLVSLQQFRSRACVVLIPWIDFTPAELIQIITECKTNISYQLTPVLCGALREAMKNPHLENLLKSLDFIVHGGAAITDNERLWAMERGIAFRNIYGSTEMGINMTSEKHPLIFHTFPVPGLVYEFRPISSNSADGERKSSTSGLVEMVVSSSSLDCPHPSICDPVDGCYHSRDLFEIVEPGGYKYRGRLDDMIVMSRGDNCDALYIENQVLLTCKELVSACVVVGTARPSPALLIELVEGESYSRQIKNEIGQKVLQINEFGWPHERIHPQRILVVPSGSLPRTPKGNINRRITEATFKEEIDKLYNDEVNGH